MAGTLTAGREALEKASPQGVRDATAADLVGGSAPRWVVRPRSTEEVSAVMQVATAHDLALVVRGAGTKLAWGRDPERLDVLLDTAGLDRVVEHAAGDLICVVGAGRSLESLQSQLSGAGQRLGIDDRRNGTVGGAVATASTGPLRLHHGAVRDLVIGMTLVRADGVVAHGGGKVVKNVAGYDLGKLLTGSFGTLGLITQVAFRLHPVPLGRRWVTAAPADARVAGSAVLAVAHSQLVPAAVELDAGAEDGAATLSVLVEGHQEGAAELARRMGELLSEAGCAEVDVAQEPPAWWGADVTPEAGDRATLLRVTHVVGGVTSLLRALAEAAAGTGCRAHLRGSPAVGVEHVAVEGGAAAVAALVQRLRTAAQGFGGQVVVLDAPDDVREQVDLWGPVQALGLMRAVKERFDPGRQLSPGRF